MSAAKLLKPHLYDAADGARPGAACTLRGGRCGRCGYVFFPLQRYGCERCGAHGDALAPATLSGQGVLLASAAVHVHEGRHPAPFVVGTVQLRDGPVVRTLLDHDPAAPALAPGQPLQAVLRSAGIDEDGQPLLDLRFAPTTA